MGMNLRILVRSTMTSTVPLEVVDEGLTVMSKIAKVYSLASRSQKQHAVENFEQFSRGLMDSRKQSDKEDPSGGTLYIRAQNSLTAVCESSQESHDGPSTLRIKPGCGFIEEKKKLRLGGKFDTNGSPLTMFHAQ